MKLLDYFRAFLEDEVNLNDTRIAVLDERVEAITNFLRESETFRDRFIGIMPQGSYAHKTIIRPVDEEDEFDADVLLHLSEFEDWAAKDYIAELYRTFRGCESYRDLVHRKPRCVTVDYTGDFHVDVVP